MNGDLMNIKERCTLSDDGKIILVPKGEDRKGYLVYHSIPIANVYPIEFRRKIDYVSMEELYVSVVGDILKEKDVFIKDCDLNE